MQLACQVDVLFDKLLYNSGLCFQGQFLWSYSGPVERFFFPPEGKSVPATEVLLYRIGIGSLPAVGQTHLNLFGEEDQGRTVEKVNSFPRKHLI